MEVDRELSRRVEAAVRDKPHSPWRTACRALRSRSELEGAFYVEGWAVALNSKLVVEHAWLELGGRIIDPTRWNYDLAYFPVLRFDKRQMLEALADYPKLPITWRGSSCLQDNPAYHQAWRNARALARSRPVGAKQAV